MASKYTYKVREVSATPRTGRVLEGAANAVRGSVNVIAGSGSTAVDANFDIVQGEGISVEKYMENGLSYTISHGNTSDALSADKVEKKALAGIGLDDFGHVTSVERCDILALDDLDKRYLRRDINDTGSGFYTWQAGWMTEAPVRSAVYNIGWEQEYPAGWYVSETGAAWYSSLNVRGPILSNNIIGSPYYTSGWTGFGSQWDLSKHFLETDYISVRKELKVYALDVFRIYGTNGDLAVSTTNKIDQVEDRGDVWRCHIDDYNGEMYMNMRIDDVVRCQTWEKKSGRYYMARVTNIDEKWFELSKDLLDGTTAPAAGDIVIRWDNLTDADRKGLVYLSASDSYAPYMDVRYGDWNATVGTIKVRNGRLDGINDPLFPELYGAKNNFGLYTSNFYGTGELILRSTGESVSRTFEVLKDSMRAGFDDIRYEIRVSEDSILLNPIFQDGTSSWEIHNVFYPWLISGGMLTANNRPFMNFVSGALLTDDPVNNRTVLQVMDTTVTQRNELFTDRTEGKYALRFSYRSLLDWGSLEVGVPGSDVYSRVSLSANSTYQRAEIVGDWDGTGDFVIKVTGGAVNITDISFTADKLGNAINQIKVEYDTRLTLKADQALMESFRKEYDEFNRVVLEDYATQSWTATKISTEVGTIVDGKLRNYSTTSQTSTLISNAVYNLDLWQYATTTWTSQQISSSVSDKATVSYVNQKASDLTISFNDKLSPITAVTGAFYSFDSNRMRLNRRIEMGTGTNTNFTCVSGFSPDTTKAAFWAGSTWENQLNARIKLNHDGSGWLAGGNILWNVNGDCYFTGRMQSAADGNRIIINPYTRSLEMINDSGKVVAKLSFENIIGNQSTPSLELFIHRADGALLRTVRLHYGGLYQVDGSGNLLSSLTTGLTITGMPIIDPKVKGMFWRDGTNVKVSLG